MHVITKKRLSEFWTKYAYADAEGPLKAWYKEAKDASWRDTAELKERYPSASFVGRCTVFNIGGNKYRLIVWVNYKCGKVFIRWVGTHKEYDKLNVGAM